MRCCYLHTEHTRSPRVIFRYFTKHCCWTQWASSATSSCRSLRLCRLTHHWVVSSWYQWWPFISCIRLLYFSFQTSYMLSLCGAFLFWECSWETRLDKIPLIFLHMQWLKAVVAIYWLITMALLGNPSKISLSMINSIIFDIPFIASNIPRGTLMDWVQW